MAAPLLEVEDLSVGFWGYDPDAPYFAARKRLVDVVRDVSFTLDHGEVLALVGASGSGKSLLAHALLGLFDDNSRVTGSVRFKGRPLTPEAFAQLRGRGISFVPQSVAFLDPLMKVGRQVVGGPGKPDETPEERERRARELFAHFGLDARVWDSYPHELSGGQLRRVLFICAQMDAAELVVADEPSPGLDDEQAAHVAGHLRRFADAGGGVLFITHDIELALRVADRVAVLREGGLVATVAADDFRAGRLSDPYVAALRRALPEHDFAADARYL